jgi:hypothetical protein
MSAMASAVTAFNLLCTIHASSVGGIATLDENGKEYTFVIDLETGRYCAKYLCETKPISRVTDATIFLIEKTGDPSSISLWISRETGRLDWEFGAGNDQTVRMGKCEKQPFTGFPARKF